MHVKSEEELAAEAAKRAAEEAAAAHANFLARYLNGPIERKPGAKTFALVVASEDGRMNRPLADLVIRRFKTEGVDFSLTYLKPEFASDGLLAQVLSGSTKVIKDLELANTLDGLLLAQQQVEYVPNPQLENVISAHMHLEVLAISLAADGTSQNWGFDANGAGFKEKDARALAEERLHKQLGADTKMTLERVLPSNPK